MIDALKKVSKADMGREGKLERLAEFLTFIFNFI